MALKSERFVGLCIGWIGKAATNHHRTEIAGQNPWDGIPSAALNLLEVLKRRQLDNRVVVKELPQSVDELIVDAHIASRHGNCVVQRDALLG